MDGRYGGSVQAGEAVVAKQADGQERNERREDFRQLIEKDAVGRPVNASEVVVRSNWRLAGLLVC